MEAATANEQTAPQTPLPRKGCGNCGKVSAVMIVMEKGLDGVAWALCSRCWQDGARPIRLLKLV